MSATKPVRELAAPAAATTFSGRDGHRAQPRPTRVRMVAAAQPGAQEEPHGEIGMDPGRARPTHAKLRLGASLVDAIVRHALQGASGADWELDIALELAEPHGQVFPFLVPPQPELPKGNPRPSATDALPPDESWSHAIVALPNSHGDDTEPHHEPLTESENRVLRYLPTNLSAKEIASELYVSVNTVKTHIRHIYAKLDANSRSEAVERARALSLLAVRRRSSQQRFAG